MGSKAELGIVDQVSFVHTGTLYVSAIGAAQIPQRGAVPVDFDADVLA